MVSCNKKINSCFQEEKTQLQESKEEGEYIINLNDLIQESKIEDLIDKSDITVSCCNKFFKIKSIDVCKEIKCIAESKF